MNIPWNNTWTPEREAWLIMLSEAGQSWRKIARAMGVSGRTVNERAAKLGLEPIRYQVEWPKERDMQLRQLVFEFGLSYSEAAKEMGMTKNQLIGRANRLGLMKPTKVRLTLIDRLDALNIFPPPGRCVYPTGHLGDDDFGFCGSHAHGGAYCLTHRAKTSYRPAKAAA